MGKKFDLQLAVVAAQDHLVNKCGFSQMDAVRRKVPSLCALLNLRYPDGTKPKGRVAKEEALVSWADTRRHVVLKNEWLEAKKTIYQTPVGEIKNTHTLRKIAESNTALLNSALSQTIKHSRVQRFSLHDKVNSDSFLHSFEWKRLRMRAIMEYGTKCQCCGASAKTGAVINVDHIKPRKLFPHLALDISNLQILCSDCNIGKGNLYLADFRKSA